MDEFFYRLRTPEVGANAFHSLSLRLATSGEEHEALVNAEKAVQLYRELVAQAPGHLPSLASGLRNLSSLLYDAGRGEESIVFCDEAVGIMRNVADSEQYLIPELIKALEQLVGYLEQLGFTYRAAAVTAECADIRRKFACLPPQPEFLFKELDIQEEDSNETDEGWATDGTEGSRETDGAEDGWETASEWEGNLKLANNGVIAEGTLSISDSLHLGVTTGMSESASALAEFHPDNGTSTKEAAPPIDTVTAEDYGDFVGGTHHPKRIPDVFFDLPVEVLGMRNKSSDFLLRILVGSMAVLIGILSVAVMILWKLSSPIADLDW
ncbi:hypothetical protein C8R46DRAFT_1222364 [Mycena filopes]|nr:hypothetical protein C8R46DRAFT_1222364 [Mycena filopes]